MRCMIEETFGPTLPVMKVADAEEAVTLANDGPYGLQASVWTRDTERGEALARRHRVGRRVRQRRAGQLRRARAADGRLEGLRAGLAPRARRHPQVHEAPVADDHPGLRAVARRPLLPVLGRGLDGDRRDVRGARHKRDLQRRPAARRSWRSPTRSCRRSTRRTGESDPHGLLGPRGVAPERAGGDRDRPAAVGGARGAGRGPAPAARLAGARTGWRRRRRRRRARQIVHGFADSGPEALAGISALRGLTLSIFYALPELGTGRNPSWDAIGYPGRRRLPAPTSKPLDRPPAGGGRGRDDARGGRLRGRLGRRRRRHRRHPRRGRQAGLRRRDGRLLQRGRLQRARGVGLPEPLPARWPDADRRGPGLDPGRARRSAAARSSTGRTACARSRGFASSGPREFGLEGLDGPDYDAHLDAVSSGSASTTPARS